MKETKQLEFKESVTNTFLKTVSAFANYGTGKIVFGIKDDGSLLGIENPSVTCLDIENRINDSIDPVPDYSLDVKNSTVILTVFDGLHKPYFYKSKAYRRSDTATVEVDRLELTRLILEGQNSSFEELVASEQKLSFSILEKKLIENLNLKAVTIDTLKTLELYNETIGYNKAGELLADTNKFNGIDIIRFGDNINILLDHETYQNESILIQYDHAISMFRKYYTYEEIKGSKREDISLIPEEAFREAIVNALIHRAWDVPANINVAMFKEKIEITSPGGLPKGMNEEDYLRGGISILRNRILGEIFYRLHLIEHFGTGIRRINEFYKGSDVKPVFKVLENSVRIILPVIKTTSKLTKDENTVYSLIKGKSVSSSTITELTGFGKTKTLAILKRLLADGYIKSLGVGRGIKYTTE